MPACDPPGVILDVDGTLVASNDAHAQAWSESFRQNGYDVDAATVRPLMGMGGDKILPAVIGVEADSIAGRLVADQRLAVFLRTQLPLLHETRGARHLVQRLLDRGHRVAVATSASAEEVRGLLRVAGLLDLFPERAVVSRDDTRDGRSKPDADAVAVALERLGCPAASALMIGDTPYDIEAAGRLGLRTIALRCGGFSEQDLANAVTIYDDPQDLVDQYDASPLAGADTSRSPALRTPAARD